MAEREGFEPSVGVTLRRFSKPVPSASRPPLRVRRARLGPPRCGDLADLGRRDKRRETAVGGQSGRRYGSALLTEPSPLGGELGAAEQAVDSSEQLLEGASLGNEGNVPNVFGEVVHGGCRVESEGDVAGIVLRS